MQSTVMRFGAISILIACNGKDSTTADEVPRAVHGVAVQHNITDNGIVDQPRDLSTTSLRSHGRTGTAVERRVGSARLDGSFAVPIADGATEWQLEIQRGDTRTFLGGNSPAPDLSVYHFGRGDAQRATSDTHVTFDITGLSAWATADRLQLVSPNVGMTMAGPENEFSSYPRTGETAITGQTLNWKTAFAPLIDAAKGDTMIVTQLTAATSGARSYTALARAGIAREFTMRDGHPATLAATLLPVAQDREFALRWRGSQFAALAPQAGPGAQAGPAATVAISALPDAIAHHNDFFATYYMGLPNLVVFPPLPASDLDQTVAYGNPFTSLGARWSELVTVVYASAVPVPTKQGIGSLPARIVAAMPVASLSEGAITPAISPVRAPKIDGLDLDAPRTGVGISPTISWQAPALGTATDYAVVVHAVNGSDQGVSTKTIATLYTRSTSLELPAALLEPASSYVLTITAISAPDADLTRQPFVGTLPFAAADHVTAQFTP